MSCDGYDRMPREKTFLSNPRGNNSSTSRWGTNQFAAEILYVKRIFRFAFVQENMRFSREETGKNVGGKTGVT